MNVVATPAPDPLPALRAEVTRRLKAAADALRVEHQSRLGAPYPPASSPGEYPRKRTGRLQGSVVTAVQSPDVVVIGYATDAGYGIDLEFNRQRLGLRQTLADMKPALASIIAGEGRE